MKSEQIILWLWALVGRAAVIDVANPVFNPITSKTYSYIEYDKCMESPFNNHCLDQNFVSGVCCTNNPLINKTSPFEFLPKSTKHLAFLHSDLFRLGLLNTALLLVEDLEPSILSQGIHLIAPRSNKV